MLRNPIMEEVRATGMQEGLLRVVQEKFHKVPAAIRDAVESCIDKETLGGWLVRASLEPDLDSFQRHVLNSSEAKPRKSKKKGG